MALTSLAAGLWYGARRFAGALTVRYLWLAALFNAALIPPIFAPSILSIVVLMALAGSFLAPLSTCTYTLIDRLAPVGTLTEAFTWLTAANVAGAAGGNALAGVLSQSTGVRSALAVAAISGASAVAISLARRRTLLTPIPPIAGWVGDMPSEKP